MVGLPNRHVAIPRDDAPRRSWGESETNMLWSAGAFSDRTAARSIGELGTEGRILRRQVRREGNQEFLEVDEGFAQVEQDERFRHRSSFEGRSRFKSREPPAASCIPAN